MSLQTRLGALITAIGTDVKAVKSAIASPTLPATLSPAAPVNTERQRWTRLADGAMVAEVDAITTAGVNQRGQYQIHARAAGVEKAQIDLDAAHSEGSSAGIYLQNAPYAASAKRRASAQVTKDDLSGAITKDIIRSDGTSDLIFADGRELGMRTSQPNWNFVPDGYGAPPSARNRYLTETDRKVIWFDLPSGGTLDFWLGDGFWIVKSFYGYHYDANINSFATIYCSRYTSDGATRYIAIRDQHSPVINTSVSYSVVNNNSTSGVIRATASHGNTRIIAQDLRGQTATGV